ncbi:MotB family protein [Aurantimonas aggregata]|uniref:MotB family protein n=1 Tax=Aurantimonas aggregata TaxID=2047720 RepID=A0A6L9MDB9_9HYPH|nr:MotB family protein [Aurantimonas aggregata]NDV85737.1 MotB family protein [Aurantimonas aggregata]
MAYGAGRGTGVSEQAGAGHLERQEIIIVRRRAPVDEGHHGGVWKIAFADFMTAMMAFFLVMWLTNTSDMATRKQVAQYFNPIKLTDTAPASRGVETKDDGASRDDNERGVSRVDTNGDTHGKPLAGEQQGGDEQAMFRDPYAVLAEIASESSATSNTYDNGVPDGSGLPGMNGGDAYRDPFDPASWQIARNTVDNGGMLEEVPPAEFRTAVIPVDPAIEAGEEAMPVPDDKAATGEEKTGEEKAGEGGPGDVADAVKADLEIELAKAGQSLPANLEISEGEGGVTISLVDDAVSGMFAIGSARPTPEAVAMMEKIAAALAKREGEVVIRGHTDARPFASGEYDNWRLSTARAHMAYYMLARGGLDESRVRAIEGFADREPRDPANPEAAINRRIEILLTVPSA